MKRRVLIMRLMMVMCVLSTAFVWAAPRATLTPVKATHQRHQRHRPHKAGKHPRPKRGNRHTV